MAYAYPGPLGEWLGTAVQIAASVSWQSHWALRPLERLDAHEHPIAEQGRSFLELYGAVLVGALAACDRALDREADAVAAVELPAVDSVVEVWDEARDEARDEREGLLFSLGRLGDEL
jgi:hypothetical protein